MRDYVHENLCEVIAKEVGSTEFAPNVRGAALAARKFLGNAEDVRLRDEFATAALSAIIAKRSSVVCYVREDKTPAQNIALDAYELADAMMKARGQ